MNEKDIISKHYLLFSRYYLSPKFTHMCYGIQTGKGWYPIIDDLCNKIQKLIDDRRIDKFQFESIKEKYGTLRIQSHTYFKETDALIQLAKTKASITCENCSKHVIYNAMSDENNTEFKVYNVLCDDCKW